MNFFIKLKGNQYKKKLKKLIQNFKSPLDWLRINTLQSNMAKEVFVGTVDIEDYNEVRKMIVQIKQTAGYESL